MSDISSVAELAINYSGGAFTLERVKSATVKFDKKKEVVLAIGVDGGAGFRRMNGGGELTLDVYSEDGPPEVDYTTVCLTDEQFSFTLQFLDNGERFQFRKCEVSSPPEIKVDAEGNNMLSVIVKFLNFGTI